MALRPATRRPRCLRPPAGPAECTRAAVDMSEATSGCGACRRRQHQSRHSFAGKELDPRLETRLRGGARCASPTPSAAARPAIDGAASKRAFPAWRRSATHSPADRATRATRAPARVRADVPGSMRPRGRGGLGRRRFDATWTRRDDGAAAGTEQTQEPTRGAERRLARGRGSSRVFVPWRQAARRLGQPRRALMLATPIPRALAQVLRVPMRCSAAARWPRPALRLSRGRAYWPGGRAGDRARGLAN